ncbi:hypothetical protein QTP70_002584 [Hemibagrus guttatus]|uniref:C2 domain-containing protein n=1 Tax=Hemibagrus guttatus TaxID=175788 RepID=A0AAE0QWH3_9TELE|nr:hypothetical protein QTP70_002584 [Hemibagrus guttatus]KAK3564872.1 hypothetical protein QTP86_030813 [Hemibagrus guttatus]
MTAWPLPTPPPSSKFFDNTVVVRLISDNNETAYLEEIRNLENWCQRNNLLLNVSKTKELIVDFSTKQERNYQTPLINESPVERLDLFRYLGVHITQDLSWSCHINTVVKKARQRLYHLRRLRELLLLHHRDKRCWTKARKIVKDLSHPNNGLFSLLESGKRFRSLKANTERLKRSFFLQLIGIEDTERTEGEMREKEEDRISRSSQGLEGVRFGDHRISSLIFADVVLLAPSSLDLQHALGRFAVECEAAGMRVSTSKSEAMVLDRKKVACTLQVGGEVLPQVEEFKYLGVLFTSEGRMDREIDRRIVAAAAVMRSMYRSVVVKKELSRKAKLSIYLSIYVPTLTYGHELWVMTERVRSRIQAAEMSFVRRVAGRSLRDRVRSSVTREGLGVEPLLLHIERWQLRWLGHLFRMPPGRLPGEVFRACPTGKRPRGRPRTRWRDCLSAGLGTPQGPSRRAGGSVWGEGDVSVSLLSLMVTSCGLALFGVSLFVSWKLFWVPWRDRFWPSNLKEQQGEKQLVLTEEELLEREYSGDFFKDTSVPMLVPESAMKISHTSPDIQLEAQTKAKEHNHVHIARVQRQITDPISSVRHNSIRRQMNLSSPEFSPAQFQRQESLSGPGLGRIKPELYKQRSVDTDDGRRADSCGRLHFVLKYDCDLEQLIVKIHKAEDLPAKDFSGTSDPYVKIYLLPERKTKHQTKVHRKTLNPVFDEVFLFPVTYGELHARKLHFSVYDFDRFSRHDLIGQVVVDNFLDLPDFPGETRLCRDILYVTADNVDLGDLMFSLCYLPTAGRLTITIIKARNLKAMDITGASDPYVKVSLMCDGRRLKKRKTSTKRNTLNPIYNEAIVFDVPPENIDQISLLIAVMDYDRVGHNEIIGVCRVGNMAESLGRDHWNEMLSYPRKPIAHWHPLVEWSSEGNPGGSQGSCNSLKTPPSP